MIVPTMTAMTTRTHALVMISETLMRIRVGNGSFPPKDENRFLEDGNDEHDHGGEDDQHDAQHNRRVGHGRPDGPIQLGLLLDGLGQASEYLVEISAGLSGLDQGAEQIGEDLRVLGAGR